MRKVFVLFIHFRFFSSRYNLLTRVRGTIRFDSMGIEIKISWKLVEISLHRLLFQRSNDFFNKRNAFIKKRQAERNISFSILQDCN